MMLFIKSWVVEVWAWQSAPSEWVGEASERFYVLFCVLPFFKSSTLYFCQIRNEKSNNTITSKCFFCCCYCYCYHMLVLNPGWWIDSFWRKIFQQSDRHCRDSRGRSGVSGRVACQRQAPSVFVIWTGWIRCATVTRAIQYSNTCDVHHRIRHRWESNRAACKPRSRSSELISQLRRT